MKKFGNYIKQNLSDIQSRVENKLEVDLGKIEVIPLRHFAKHTIEKEGDSLTKFQKNLSLALGAVYGYTTTQFRGAAAAGNSTIYYNESPLVLLMTKDDMAATTAHELTHLAHEKITGKSMNEINMPWHQTEGFANYIARDVMRDRGVDYVAEETSLADIGTEEFIEMMKEKKINDYRSLKDFIKNNS